MMPTLLGNGVEVVNLTPHPLWFACKEGLVKADPDAVLGALPVNEIVKVEKGYSLTELRFQPLREGLDLIRKLKEKHPNALLVGSSIAAQTYRGEVVAPVPVRKGTARQRQRPYRPDLFTTYPLYSKENN